MATRVTRFPRQKAFASEIRRAVSRHQLFHRWFPAVAGLLFVACWWMTLVPALNAQSPQRPNIILILADDMDYWLWRDFAIGAKTLLNCKEKRGSVSSPAALGLRGIDGKPV